MTWVNWIPAIVTTGALAIVAWMVRVPLKKWIESAISSRFEEKLERLRAELRDRGADVDALRSGAFVNFSARHAELGKRRLHAVERVWAEVTELGRFEHLSTFAQSLNVDEIIKSTSKSAIDRKKMSDFATTLLGELADPKAKPFEATANKERPFVPELTFALFLAYRQTVLWPYLFLQACRLAGC